jgi:hypothetical protein
MGIRMGRVGLGPRAFRDGKSLLLMAFALAIAVLAVTAEPATPAATFTVNSTGLKADAIPGNGVCATRDGVCTLRAAIHETNSLAGADTIQLPAGTYPISRPATEPNDIRTGDLDVLGDLTINGAGRTSTIIAGNKLDRVFEIHSSGNVSINAVTIRTGSHPQSGAGILNAGNGNVTIARSLILNNSAAKFGGGVANAQAGTVRLRAATRVSGNSAGQAGSAVSNLAAGSVQITQSTVSANSSTLGGAAISNTGVGPNQGSLTLSRATVANNVAGSGTNEGGGISNAGDGLVTVDQSTISGNRSAASGGGIANTGSGTVDVANSTVSGNTATVDGGGILVLAPVTLASSTIAHNSAPVGGGLRKVGGSRVLMRNSIIANNEGGNCSLEPETLPVDSDGGNLDSGTTCRLTQPTDISGVDPLLGPLQNNGGGTQTHALDPLSSALDAAVSSLCPARDQRGVSRPQHDGCDIGAYEFDGVIGPPACTGDTLTLTATKDSWVDEHDPDKNFGTATELKLRSAPLGATGNSRVLVGFELPTLPAGCQVLAATLRLNAEASTEGRSLRAFALGSSWAEGAVSWNNQPATTGAASTITAAKGILQWNVTAQVQGMYSSGQNHGFMIRDSAENDVAAEQSFSARDSGSNPAPQLVVTFG